MSDESTATTAPAAGAYREPGDVPGRGFAQGEPCRGYRGQPAADIDALADVLLRVSRLADDLPEVAELDLNPVLAMADGCLAVDARVRVVPARPQDPFLRQLR